MSFPRRQLWTTSVSSLGHKARSIQAAINRYSAPMQRALSCITESRIWITPGRGSERRFLDLAGGEPVRLKRVEMESLYLNAAQDFVVEHDGTEFRVRTRGYIYAVWPSEVSGGRFLSWHWHPPKPSRPHVHIADRSTGHIPSGRVTFESVVRYLIEELGVRPARSDWDDVLMATEALHARFRRWSIAPEVEGPDQGKIGPR